MSANFERYRRKVVFVPSYTCLGRESPGSDEIGYGVTVGDVLNRGLLALGYQVVNAADFISPNITTKLAFIHETYRVLSEIPLDDTDAVLMFHAFHQFPSEMRRIFCERGRPDLPILGFTHGSHLDETDLVRTERFPGMQMADLGNICCLNRVLVVSEYFRSLLAQRIASLCPGIALQLEPRLTVTGLAVDPEFIDRERPVGIDKNPANQVTAVFNHSPHHAKAPERCFSIVHRVMADLPLRLVVTRRFQPSNPGHAELAMLCTAYGDRVILGNTLSLPAYYRTLWEADVQLSTALHETFGVATLEAMYTGNCCLVPNRQAYPELTGGAGLYNDESELESMLRMAVCDPNARSEIAKRQQVRSRFFLPEAMVRRVADAIEAAALIQADVA